MNDRLARMRELGQAPWVDELSRESIVTLVLAFPPPASAAGAHAMAAAIASRVIRLNVPPRFPVRRPRSLRRPVLGV